MHFIKAVMNLKSSAGDLGWILGKYLLVGIFRDGIRLPREVKESASLETFRLLFDKCLPGVI